MDLGRKQESTAVEAPAENKDSVSYPSLYLRDLPDLNLEDKDVGKEFNITGKVKVCSINKRADEKDKNSVEVQLDVLEIDFEKRKGKADLAKSLKE